MNIKREYESPVIQMQQVMLEQVIAGSSDGGAGSGEWVPLDPGDNVESGGFGELVPLDV